MSSRNSGVALLIASTLFVVAHASGDLCQGYVVSPQEQHVFQTQESNHCLSQELVNRYEQQLQKSYCEVRSTLLKLNSDDEYTYHPESVEVRRCIGTCSEANCLSIRNASRNVQVTRKHIGGRSMCGQVKVLDHLECDCV